MASGKSNEDFRRRRLSLVDQDPANLAKAAAAMQVSPAGTSKPKARRLSVSPEMGQKSVVPVSFNPELCGTYSCHGIEPMGATGAKAKINQDRGCVVTPFAEPEDGSYVQALFCVYDGHGASGDKASEFTMRKVADLVEQKLTAGIKEPEALRTAFLETDALLKADRTIDAELSGTTAVAMLLRQTGSKREAWLAWVGDSRAVWAQPQPSEKSGYKAQNLTEDQKPDTPAEMARIKQAGGFVSPPEEEWGGPARVWIDAEMTLPGLAMARSIGDHLVKTVGVIAEPEVVHFDNLASGFIVIASDGVWEFIDSQQAVDLIAKFISKGSTEAVTKLIETAAAKWRQEEGDYRDDITAICIQICDGLFATLE